MRYGHDKALKIWLHFQAPRVMISNAVSKFHPFTGISPQESIIGQYTGTLVSLYYIDLLIYEDICKYSYWYHPSLSLSLAICGSSMKLLKTHSGPLSMYQTQIYVRRYRYIFINICRRKYRVSKVPLLQRRLTVYCDGSAFIWSHLYLTPGRPHLEFHAQVWTYQYEKDIDILEWAQQMSNKIVWFWSTWHMSKAWESWLTHPGDETRLEGL